MRSSGYTIEHEAAESTYEIGQRRRIRGSVTLEELFWIEMKQDQTKDYNFNDPSIIWAKETLSTLSFKKVKKKKGRTKKALKNITYKSPKKGEVERILPYSYLFNLNSKALLTKSFRFT